MPVPELPPDEELTLLVVFEEPDEPPEFVTGTAVGAGVGTAVGTAVGSAVGVGVGATVGAGVDVDTTAGVDVGASVVIAVGDGVALMDELVGLVFKSTEPSAGTNIPDIISKINPTAVNNKFFDE